ncbi:MAG TPA: XdhC family protein [Anaerolineales bacterium]|nr:XdhC family protein [Anaerolineales bacterium]HNQ95955.1 XdhC family protein [Anaerolineales bacterium]
MRDILIDIQHWQKEGESIALATVIQTWGSAPRRIGSHMAFTLSGKIAGSVSGGCVENTVIEAGMQVLKMNHPQLLHFGVADETAWGVGLACGGSIDVFVQPLDAQVFHEIKKVINNEEGAHHVTVIGGAEELLGEQVLIQDNRIVAGSLGNGIDSRVLNLSPEISMPQQLAMEEAQVFINVIRPAPTLVIVGGVHIAIALASLAKTLGYQIILIDPRKAWGNETRFPHVDSLIQLWVDEAFEQIKINPSTAIAVLTHDPKIDDPAIKLALNSSAFYVGALGSKNTNAKRRERLLSDGVSESQMDKVHAPIGLDIGAQNPEEIALAVMSQIVQTFRKQNQVEGKREAQSLVCNL